MSRPREIRQPSTAPAIAVIGLVTTWAFGTAGLLSIVLGLPFTKQCFVLAAVSAAAMALLLTFRPRRKEG